MTIGGICDATYRKSKGYENAKSVRRAKTAKTNRARKPGPIATVTFGSASVPVYRSKSKGRTLFMLCSYRDGKRIRKIFSSLDEAKKEALFVAQRIQSGTQHVTGMKPHELHHVFTTRWQKQIRELHKSATHEAMLRDRLGDELFGKVATVRQDLAHRPARPLALAFLQS